MIKAEISERVSKRVRIPKEEAAELVDVVFEALREALERGDRVKVSGFGKFIVRAKQARVGRNTQSGSKIEIVARRVATFRLSDLLRKALNSNADTASGVPARSSGSVRHERQWPAPLEVRK